MSEKKNRSMRTRFTRSKRIARLAHDYAQKNHKGKVSIITKANIIKTTDGKFLKTAQMIGQEYPEIVTDDWYIDITTAKLIDPMRRKDFKVFVLPNLFCKHRQEVCNV